MLEILQISGILLGMFPVSWLLCNDRLINFGKVSSSVGKLPVIILWFSQSCSKLGKLITLEKPALILFLPKFKWIKFCKLEISEGMLAIELFSKDSHSRFCRFCKFVNSAMSVSYTHLDVYKRQS